MGPLEFAYWLRGFFEIGGERALTKEEATIISQHLALVFEEQAKTKKPISKSDMEKAIRDIQKTPLDLRDRVACAQAPETEGVELSFVEDYDPMTGGPLYCTVSCGPKDSKAWDL